MKKQDLEFFENKKVKLVKLDGFTLYGIILSINDDNIFFQTPQATSLIKIDNIREVTTREGY